MDASRLAIAGNRRHLAVVVCQNRLRLAVILSSGVLEVEYSDGGGGWILILLAIAVLVGLFFLFVFVGAGALDIRDRSLARRRKRAGCSVEFKSVPRDDSKIVDHYSRVVDAQGKPVTDWQGYSPTSGASNEMWHLGR